MKNDFIKQILQEGLNLALKKESAEAAAQYLRTEHQTQIEKVGDDYQITEPGGTMTLTPQEVINFANHLREYGWDYKLQEGLNLPKKFVPYPMLKDTVIGKTTFEAFGQSYRLTGYYYMYITSDGERIHVPVHKEDANAVSGAGIAGGIWMVEDIKILPRISKYGDHEDILRNDNAHMERMIADAAPKFQFLKSLPEGLSYEEYDERLTNWAVDEAMKSMGWNTEDEDELQEGLNLQKKKYIEDVRTGLKHGGWMKWFWDGPAQEGGHVVRKEFYDKDDNLILWRNYIYDQYGTEVVSYDSNDTVSGDWNVYDKNRGQMGVLDLNEGLNMPKSNTRTIYWQLDDDGLNYTSMAEEQIDFTKPWEKEIFDKNGRKIHHETSEGYWQKFKYNDDGVMVSYSDSDHAGGPLSEGLNLPKKKDYWEYEELVARSFIYVSEWYKDKQPIKSDINNWGSHSIKIPNWYLDYQLKLFWEEDLWQILQMLVLDSNDVVQMNDNIIIPKNAVLTDFLQLIGQYDRKLKERFAKTLELESDEELIQEGLNLQKKSRKEMVFQFLNDQGKIYEAYRVYDDQPRYFINLDSVGENGFFIEKLNEQNLADRLESEKSGWRGNSPLKDGYAVTSWHVGAQKEITDHLNIRSSELVDPHGMITDFNLGLEINEYVLDWFLQNKVITLNEGLNLPKKDHRTEVKVIFDKVASYYGVDRAIVDEIDVAKRPIVKCKFRLYGNEQTGYLFVELFHILNSSEHYWHIYGSIGLNDNYPDAIYTMDVYRDRGAEGLINDIDRKRDFILSLV